MGAGDRNAPNDNVFVTDMPTGLDEQAVTDLFNQYGTVLSARVVSKPHHSWTSAMVRFASVDEATSVVDGLHEQIPAGLDKPIKVEFAGLRRKPLLGGSADEDGYAANDVGLNEDAGALPDDAGLQAEYSLDGEMDNTASHGTHSPYVTGGAQPTRAGPDCNLYVGGLPAQATAADLRAAFGQVGNVVTAKILATWQVSASALVRMSTIDEATIAIQTFNGGTVDGAGSAPITVRHAKATGTPSSGRGSTAIVSYGAPAGGCSSSVPAVSKGGHNCKGGKVGHKGGSARGDPSSMNSIIRCVEDSGNLPGGDGKQHDMYVEIYVFGLPKNTRDIHLYRMFSSFGQISPKGVKAELDNQTGECRGFGFINYLAVESADMAIRTLNEFEVSPGKRLKVEMKSDRM